MSERLMGTLAALRWTSGYVNRVIADRGCGANRIRVALR